MRGLLEGLRNTPLNDDSAKLLLYDLVFDGHVVAPSQLGKIHSWYFAPGQIASKQDLDRGLSDVTPRTALAALNAVTRVSREFSPQRQQETGVALSSYVASYFRMPVAVPDEAGNN